MRILLVLAFGLAGCGSASPGGTSVAAAFYPLAYAAAEVGGPGVHVENLTPPGAEPHDVELSPREVGRVQQADVVLFLSHGFQPAVEAAVADARGERVDALAGIRLVQDDPHVWLDPVLFAKVVGRIGGALGRPAQAAALRERLHALDGEFRRGLAHCRQRTFVTSHAAFSYLARRYGLHQLAITGVDPESEPSPRSLSRLTKLVRERRVTTVFFERLVSPRLAETVAREAGAKTAVLDPIEGLTDAEAEAGATYVSVMRQNLANLRAALGCT